MHKLKFTDTKPNDPSDIDSWVSAFEHLVHDGLGNHDLFSIYSDPTIIEQLGAALTQPYQHLNITAIAAIEARGFLIGPLCSLALNVPLIPIRKSPHMLVAPVVSVGTKPDWEGKISTLYISNRSIERKARVLLVDDWLTTGSQARAVKFLLERCDAKLVGTAAFVEDGMPDFERGLGQMHVLLRWNADQELFMRSRLNRIATPN